MVNDFTLSPPSLDATTGVMTLQDGTTLDMQSVFPGLDSTSAAAESMVSPGATHDVAVLEEASNSTDDMEELGMHNRAMLYNDATSSNPTVTGEAYLSVLKTLELSRPDLTGDPVFTKTQEVQSDENMEIFADNFGDCSTGTTFTNDTYYERIPEYKNCLRLYKPEGDCEIIHEISVSADIFQAFIAGKGREVLTVNVDFINGTWATTTPTDGIPGYFRGDVPTINYDEYCGEDSSVIIENTSNSVWAGIVPSVIPGSLDDTVAFSVLQEPSCENGLKAKLQVRDLQSGGSDRHVLTGVFSFRFATIDNDSWYPEECIHEANQIFGEFCEGELTVTAGALTETDCSVINGVNVCPGDAIYNHLTGSCVFL